MNEEAVSYTARTVGASFTSRLVRHGKRVFGTHRQSPMLGTSGVHLKIVFN